MASEATLTPRDLRPGDVLLCRGSERLGCPISDWICRLDGGLYSHAALWDGEAVLEASGTGGKIREADLARLIAEHEYTHVYRRAGDGRSLGDPGWSADPVLEVARSLVGAGYPHRELYLIGVLVGLGRAIGHPRSQELLRALGAELTEAIAGRRWPRAARTMTCSQFVSAVFWEADPSPARRYALEVPYEPTEMWRGAHDARAVGGESALRELTQACHQAFLTEAARAHITYYREDLARGRRGWRALGVQTMLVRAGDRELPSTCVTPRDLERSPSLCRLGSLRT